MRTPWPGISFNPWLRYAKSWKARPRKLPRQCSCSGLAGRPPTPLSHFIDTKLRPTGYRLVGAFEHSSGAAVSIVGFRELWSTASGYHMYIDDVSTLETARGNGFADELMRWVIADAKRRQCEGVHLDSGVGSDRAAAHRLYMRNRLRISAHHFSLEVDS